MAKRVQLRRPKDLAKMMMRIVNQPSTKEFLGAVIQPLFLKTSLEKDQVLFSWDGNKLRGFLVWNIRKINAKAPFVLGKGDFNIKYVAVDNDYKRQGVASDLSEQAKQIAIQHGCHRIVTHVRTDNKRMIAFRKSLGYKIINTATGNNGVEMHEFCLKLSKPDGLFEE